MNILYVAADRRAAELAAYALRNIAQNVKVSWAGTHPAALGWVEGNRDAAALIFEADIQDPNCAAFVGNLRERGLTAPVFVVAPDQDGPLPAMLGTGPDDYVVSNQSLLADLPDTVRRGLQRAQTRDSLSHQLKEAVAALELAQQQRAAEADQAAERYRRREAELGTALDESVAFRSALEFRVTVVEAAREQAERQAAVEKAAAVDRQAALEGRLLQEATSRERLQRKLAEIEKARLDAVQRHAAADEKCDALEQTLAESRAAFQRSERQRESEAALAAEHLSQRQAEFAASLAAIEQARDALARRLTSTSATLDDVRQSAAEAAAAADDHLSRREHELGKLIEGARSANVELERRLAEASAARQRADEEGAAERTAAADRQADLESQLEHAATTRSALEQKLTQSEAGHDDAVARFTSELASAATSLNEKQAEYDDAVRQAAMEQDALQQRILEGVVALDRARDEHAAQSRAAAEHLARREREFGAQLAEAAEERSTLERGLADLEATGRLAADRAAAQHAAAVQRQADLETEIAHAADRQTTLEQQLRDSHAACEREQHARAEESAAASAHLANREQEYGALLSEAGDRHAALQRQLADSEAARQLAHERAAAEQSAAADRQSQLEQRITQAAENRVTLEQQLRDVQAALQQEQRQRADDASAAAAHLAKREEEFGALLAEAAEVRRGLEGRLTDSETARHIAADRAAAEQAAAAQRQTDLEERLTQAAATRAALEQSLAEAEAAHRESNERYTSALNVAAAELAETQAEYAARLMETVAARDAVNRQLRDTTAALERNQQERTEEITAAARHLARREAEFGARLTQAAEDHAALERQLTETEAAGQLAEQHAAADRAAANARQKELEEERLALSGEIGQLRRTLSELRAEHQTVSRVASENVAEVARLGALLTERDVQLRDMVARHQSAQRTAMDAIAQVESKLQMTVEANSRDVAAMQSRIQTLERELEVTTSDRDALRPKADRVPLLLTQLDESRAEVRRLFEHSPYGVCRLNRDGSIVRLNRALVRLLAYRTGEELRAVDFATGVFQSPDDLRFLIERSLNTDAKDPVETTWKRKDGRRRIVRVLALAAPGDTVDVIAEDITDLRTTEEKLGQAQRLEAVGRLASEVAVTCNHLLRDVSEDGHQWLDAIGSDSALRRQGELLLGEVTRAASFLRQIAVYGEQQTNALEPVNVTDVLRSLEPVLRRVAGDNIEFVLPKGPRPIPVDVPAERVERILVNVAGYARQRMPHGGKLKIDLTKAIVDRKFLAKYPNVRPGSHALITITEENGKKPAAQWPSGQRADGDNGRTNGEKPGVDVGVLLELVGDCGGHLWMAAEPSGNMVLKIHLPQRVSDGLVDPQTPPGRPVGEPATGRWFNN